MIAGTAINGTDYNRIADSVVIPARDSIAKININGLVTSSTGSRFIKLYLLSPYSCNGIEIIDSTTLDIYDGINTKITSADTIICAGNSVAIRVDGNPTLSYSWSPATGLNNPGIREPVATPNATTLYILATTYPNTGCPPKYDTLVITVHTLPVIEAGGDQGSCEGSSIQLNATITVAETSSTYQWTGPNGFTSTVLNPSIPATTNNTGIYVFSISSDYCPDVKDSLRLSIVDPPLAPDVISPVERCLNSITQPLTVHGTDLLWYSNADGGTGSATAPTPPTNVTGTYHYYVSTKRQQCESARVPIEVSVEKCCGDNVYIPSAFTPNGDGRNDRFNIHVGEGDLVVESRIFNRWGQLVFRGRNNDSWDGTYNGQLVELGTYYYNILVGCKRGSQIERKGEVTVVR
jgi:gliding motility-associated-like protein